MPQIDVHARSNASPQRVWTLLADVRSWRDWAPLDDVSVEGATRLEKCAGFGPDASRPASA
jgi:hypothetical protein